jgi:hypothetical protein
VTSDGVGETYARFAAAHRRITAGIELQRRRIIARTEQAPTLSSGGDRELRDHRGDPGNDLDYYIYELARLQDLARALNKVFGRPREVVEALAAFEAAIPALRRVRNPLTHPSDDKRLDGVAWFDAVVRLRPRGEVEYLVDPRYDQHDAALALGRALRSFLERVRDLPDPGVERPGIAGPATPADERAAAIQIFDARYGEMEDVLWCLSRHCRASLLESRASSIIEEFVWTIRVWWGVVGVDRSSKRPFAEALAALPWSPELFEERDDPPTDAALAVSCELVKELVDSAQSLGLPRREYSWASKVLHWLLPWTVPAYDAYVRRALGLPEWDGPRAYPRVAAEVIALSRTHDGWDSTWMGASEPRSSLRAFDKWLWWRGGGDAGTAREVPKPWLVVEQLGLEANP